MAELIFEFVAYIFIDILVEFIKATVYYTGKALFILFHLNKLSQIEKPFFWKKGVVDEGDYDVSKSRIYLYGILTYMIIIVSVIYFVFFT